MFKEHVIILHNSKNFLWMWGRSRKAWYGKNDSKSGSLGWDQKKVGVGVDVGSSKESAFPIFPNFLTSSRPE